MRALTLILALLLLGAAPSPWKSEWMVVTAYSYCPCATCTNGDGKTAKMKNAWNPGVAVDPDTIPLLSYLDIPAYAYPRTNGTSKAKGAWILADDTGGSRIKGKVIDLRFLTHQEAKNKGIQYNVRIRVWTKK